MKFLHLNVFEGCKETNRFEDLVSYVNSQSFDILFLSELNDWEKNNYSLFESFKEKVGLNYGYFSKSNTSFNLGVFSRFPLDSFISISEGFHHSLAIVEFKGVRFLFTHLNPFNEDKRLLEIEVLLGYVSNSSKSVIIGDLNSLSPNDPYNSFNLLKAFKTIGLKKFGINNLRFDVIQKVLDHGYIDILSSSKKLNYTVPTDFNTDKAHAVRLRIDYFFCSHLLEESLISAYIERNTITNSLSDHFPIVFNLDL